MADDTRLSFGTDLYTEDGTKVGHVRGFDEDGFYVTLREGMEGLSVEHVRAGHEFGEAELTWRCRNCGAMRDLSGELPDSCPECGGPREELYYYIED